ncbi:MAG TPA: TonB-dependent siderophore receptor, partial [Clostridia bacterium]|nr:TonB-dependent siderophore receptor [Clostridia bacterium]
AVLPQVTVYGTNEVPGLHLNQPASTASRLDLPLREVPASVTVVDRAKLDELGARNLLEAAQLAPGVTAAEPPSTPGLFSSRGFTGNDVVLLYDGLAFGPPTMVAHPEDTWKYSRVEVLKGPASILFGEGALAGVVNLIPKTPNPERFEHEVFTSYGSFNTSRLGLGSGGPLGATGMSYRLDFSRQSSDGFVERAGHEYCDISGALRYDVSDRLTLTLSFDALWQDFGSYWGTPLIEGRVDARTREINYNVSDNITDQDSQWLRLQADWRPSDQVDVRNVLYGYLADRHWRNVERYTYVASSNALRRTSPVEITHDQDIIGDRLDALYQHELLGRENRLLAGIEGAVDDFQRDSNRPDNGFDFVNLYEPVPGRFNDVRTADTTPERNTRTVNGALLLEDRFQVLDWFSLVGGVRGEVIDVRSENLRAADSGTNTFNRTFTPVTGRIGGVIEPITNLAFYATYSTAAKAPSVLVVLDESFRDFKLERGEMVEAGLKQSLWEERLQWTLAVYQIWKEDIVTRDPADSERNLQIGEQSSYGVELGLALRPVRSWTWGANVAVLDAEFDEFNVASGNEVNSYTGNTPPNVPEVVANLWTSYRLPWNIEVGALVRYVGEVEANNANTIQLPDYVTLDLFASYRYKQVEFGLRARNVLDEEYSAWSVGDGAQVLLGAPLSVEGSICFRF